MRRKILAITALVCLIAVGSAYAATYNNYSGTKISVSGKAGSKSKPATAKVEFVYTPHSTNSADYPDPITNIDTTTADLTSNLKYFPVCAVSKIDGASSSNEAGTAVCPKGSVVATGTDTAELVSPDDPSKNAAVRCALDLDVFNVGGGKLEYQLVVPGNSASACGGETTQDAKPWGGTTKESGRTLDTDTALPPDVSTSAGGAFWGSLVHETLHYSTATVKHGGKTLPMFASTGCSKRAWSVTFTATNGSKKENTTVKGSDKC